MSTALYRRYRPDTFADVIGQEHVTEPLTRALRMDRVNHAYLFSGPRGCGKTTSARILARCLNCEQGPTDVPCGVCDSCVGLARGGAGTMDVIEIDAASHGGVDDARDLRERAMFAPAASRFKVYIIDEAHMVTSAGFNALLKLVEEPPAHVKFIFATTEPDKVIGTIRSRTHHYPFRLVPPDRLGAYIAELCHVEGVNAAKGVLPLVVRAGAGSVRDSLSVLDQLIAGSGDEGITYEGAVALLGYTDAALLDAVVDAVAAQDSATVFRIVDRVIESGHDPRRFVEDLLERLRDLIVVTAVPDDPAAVLRSVPADQLDRMAQQAARFGSAELSRAADVTNTALTEMTGATAPRLHLELLCARLLLPGADGPSGHGARLDRIERRLAAATPKPLHLNARTEAAAPVDQGEIDGVGREDVKEPATVSRPTPSISPDAPLPQASVPTARSTPTAPRAPRAPSAGMAPYVDDTVPNVSAVPDVDAVPSAGVLNVEAIRRAWPDIATALFGMKKVTFMLVKDAQVLTFADGELTLGIASEGAVANFRAGAHAELVQRAVHEVLAVTARVVAVQQGEAQRSGLGSEASLGAASRSHDVSAQGENRRTMTQESHAKEQSLGAPTAHADRSDWAASGSGGAASDLTSLPPDLSLTDPAIVDGNLVGRPVVERFLGGKVIE
ncbi:MAG: DNA polymerase III subunit gamma and tau [Actinomycetota bacterium]